jgi:two-component system, OmpR family, osmolarity sensor histidine kinase EnvZ
MQSLARRLMLAVVAVGVLALALQALAMRYWLGPLRDQLIEGTALQVRAVQLALAQVQAPAREAAAQRLQHAALRIVRVRSDSPALQVASEEPTMARQLRLDLQERLPAGSQLAVERQSSLPPGPALMRVRWTQDGELWEAQYLVAPPVLAVGITLGSWVVLLALLAAVALALTVRFITRPLEALAGQIGAQAEGLQPLALPRRASREVAQLVQAFNALSAKVQAAQREREALLAGVSHDLRTPLARIRLRVETQLEGETAALLDADLQALQHIVEQFLHYVQGETAPRPGPPVSLQALLRQVGGVQVSTARDHLVAETALRRLLQNLTDNARAHGAAPVTVRLTEEPAALVLAVEDAGAGLDAASFERALKPFVRLSEERSQLGHCGLGLAIVAQMARQLGGSLRVREKSATRPFAIELVWPEMT